MWIDDQVTHKEKVVKNITNITNWSQVILVNSYYLFFFLVMNTIKALTAHLSTGVHVFRFSWLYSLARHPAALSMLANGLLVRHMVL